MDALFLVGRVVYGTLFVVSAIVAHLVGYKMGVQYARSQGAPAPEVTVPVTGLMILAGGIGVILGVWIDLAALLLIAFLVPTAFIMHSFWKLEDPMAKGADQSQFMKDLTLAGAALIISTVAAYGGELGPTLTDPLFDLS